MTCHGVKVLCTCTCAVHVVLSMGAKRKPGGPLASPGVCRTDRICELSLQPFRVIFINNSEVKRYHTVCPICARIGREWRVWGKNNQGVNLLISLICWLKAISTLYVSQDMRIGTKYECNTKWGTLKNPQILFCVVVNACATDFKLFGEFGC